MKKLFLALATIISVSSFAEAAKVVITNNSDYTLKVWTGKMPKLITGQAVEAGQKLVLDLPDDQETTVKMYRWNMAAAASNVTGVVGRVTTAEAPSKENAFAWASAAWSFGKAVYGSYPIARVTLNPSQVVDGQIKNIIATNYEHNENTINATLVDANIADFEDLANALIPALAPALMIEDVKDEVLVELLESASISSENSNEEEPAIEEID
jgi:hypothetical protein